MESFKIYFTDEIIIGNGVTRYIGMKEEIVLFIYSIDPRIEDLHIRSFNFTLNESHIASIIKIIEKYSMGKNIIFGNADFSESDLSIKIASQKFQESYSLVIKLQSITYSCIGNFPYYYSCIDPISGDIIEIPKNQGTIKAHTSDAF